MSNDNSMSSVLGLPVEVTSFTDGKPRKAYPIKMKNFPEFVKHFAQVNPKLWTNYLIDSEGSAVHRLIEMTFTDDSVDEIMENSTVKTFSEIISTIQSINGIDFNLEEAAKNVTGV